LAQVGGEFEKFTFSEDQTGPTIIKFENIRNTGQETEFALVVVPEFGSIAILVLIISIMSIIFVTRKNSITI
jgi:predicted secreted protein with PEFG-CTERM motif